ncbi:MAG TPA: ABC transporter substrate-binding protein [Streptosporangiaceae bacterium]|nr:ABC transporter substrate-binding protein [Streptosporangiaceae bacterium]
MTSQSPAAGGSPTTKPPDPPPSASQSTSPDPSRSAPATPVSWSVATSAAAGGGMKALIAAAKAEGTLNVIALPPSFANYGKILSTFSKLYGIKINPINPFGSSQQEIAQVKRTNGAQAADVVDVQTPVAVANASLFAPYQVTTWSSIPASQKASDGAWAGDYGGYMSIGYDPTRFGKITSLNQLLSHKFSHSIALDGNPTQAPSALYGVMMANLALGGTPGNISAGVSFFHKLAAAGNLVSVPATTPLTIKSGSTPVVINWDYLNTAPVVGRSSSTWKAFIPSDAAIGSFYAQAINKNAPHPAAARLWEEYLYSQTAKGGQNLWLKGGVRPVEQAAMAADHKIDAKLASPYPTFTGPATFLTPAEVNAATKYLKSHWRKEVG